MEKDPTCSAVAGSPKPIVDIYPAAIQGDDNFCKTLEARKDAKKLLAPFVVVRASEGRVRRSLPVNDAVAYKDKMGAIASDLSCGCRRHRRPCRSAAQSVFESGVEELHNG